MWLWIRNRSLDQWAKRQTRPQFNMHSSHWAHFDKLGTGLFKLREPCVILLKKWNSDSVARCSSLVAVRLSLETFAREAQHPRDSS